MVSHWPHLLWFPNSINGSSSRILHVLCVIQLIIIFMARRTTNCCRNLNYTSTNFLSISIFHRPLEPIYNWETTMLPFYTSTLMPYKLSTSSSSNTTVITLWRHRKKVFQLNSRNELSFNCPARGRKFVLYCLKFDCQDHTQCTIEHN